MKPDSKFFDFLSVLSNNRLLLTVIFLGYLLVMAVSAAFPGLVYANCSPLKNLKLILLRPLFTDAKALPSAPLKLIFVFFGLFIFFNLNFLAGTVKTDKIAIDTDDIVDSREKLAATTKTLVIGWLGANLMKTAPDGSFMKRLSRKQTLLVNNVTDLEKIKSRGVDCCVFFANQVPLAYVMSLLSTPANDVDAVAFAKPGSGHYELLTTLNMRRNLDADRKRFINSR